MKKIIIGLLLLFSLYLISCEKVNRIVDNRSNNNVSDSLVPFRTTSKYGLLGENGKLLCKLEWDSIYQDTSNQLHVVRGNLVFPVTILNLIETNDTFWNINNNPIDTISELTNPKAFIIKSKRLFGFKNSNGQIIIPPKYLFASNFINKKSAIVKDMNNLYRLIDINGDTVTKGYYYISKDLINDTLNNEYISKTDTGYNIYEVENLFCAIQLYRNQEDFDYKAHLLTIDGKEKFTDVNWFEKKENCFLANINLISKNCYFETRALEILYEPSGNSVSYRYYIVSGNKKSFSDGLYYIVKFPVSPFLNETACFGDSYFMGKLFAFGIYIFLVINIGKWIHRKEMDKVLWSFVIFYIFVFAFMIIDIFITLFRLIFS